MKEFFCRIIGRVQMVMYRDFAKRRARSLGIRGWVRNEPDGSVSLVAQGEEQVLVRFLDELRHGPFLARVDSVAPLWRSPTERYDDFHIRYG